MCTKRRKHRNKSSRSCLFHVICARLESIFPLAAMDPACQHLRGECTATVEIGKFNVSVAEIVHYCSLSALLVVAFELYGVNSKSPCSSGKAVQLRVQAWLTQRP